MRQTRWGRYAPLVVFLWALNPALVGALTPAQLATLRADILADATLNAHPQTPDGAAAIAMAYNLPATPNFWVWRTVVTQSELVNTTSVDATTFTWVGNGFITRSTGEQAAWRELFGDQGSVNAALPQVRQAFTDIFSGTGNAAANRTHLAAVARRLATRAEKLFAAGTGSTVSPAVMGFEGLVTLQEVQDARQLP